MNLIAAVVSGEGVIQSLMFLIVIGVIFWLLWWLISYVALPEPFAKVARIIMAVAAVIVLINILLGLVGHPLFVVHW